MIRLDAAFDAVAEVARPIATETLALHKVRGRVLSAPVVAAVDSPPSDVSAMDGYAVFEDDLANLPAKLPVASEIFAGASDPGAIAPGQCARIFTGAPMPEGADRVIVQEVVERDGDGALFAQPLSPSRNVRKKGNDFTQGANLLEPGTLLGSRQIVAAAAADQLVLECWRRPRVRLLATGDELAEPGTARQRAGAIPESVSYGISALIEEWGGEALGTVRLADRLDGMERAASEAVGGADLVVVTGGASVGERDFAKTMFEPLGLELIFSKVAIKPGKPVWLGRAGDTLVMGLPGNPTSAMVTARLLLAPLVAGLAGREPQCAWRWRDVSLAAPLGACGDRETMIRASLQDDGLARPIGNQDSGAQHALAGADLLLRRLPNAEALEAGASVSALDF